jgi:hypothetical protein
LPTTNSIVSEQLNDNDARIKMIIDLMSVLDTHRAMAEKQLIK